jgi:hypothetical protein
MAVTATGAPAAAERLPTAPESTAKPAMTGRDAEYTREP